MKAEELRQVGEHLKVIYVAVGVFVGVVGFSAQYHWVFLLLLLLGAWEHCASPLPQS